MRLSILCIVFFCAGFILPTSVNADDGQTLVEEGFPAIDREWTGADYITTANILTGGKVPLPLLSSDQGRLLLKRLTDTENFSMCRDEIVPFESRLKDFSNLLLGTDLILKRYVEAANKGALVHAECMQMFVFTIRAAAVEVTLVNKHLADIPKDDNYSERMDQLRQFKSGLMTIFTGAEMSLSEKNFYSAKDLSDLLAVIAETLPTVKDSFSAAYRLELHKKLEARKAAFSQDQDSRNIQEMVAMLGK